jgi:DNA-binding transcriptional MerR regulator
MSAHIPDKIYFKIGEVSEIAQVAAHVLRYWEDEFRQIRPKRIGSKQRLYRRCDVELILKIKSLLHVQGYTISGARKVLKHGATQPQDQGRMISIKCLQQIKTELEKIKTILAK